MLEYATRMGNYFLRKLHGLQLQYPYLIMGVRGLGPMDTVELDTRQRRDRLMQKALSLGLLLPRCRYKRIRFLPPLDVRKWKNRSGFGYFGRGVSRIRMTGFENR